MFFEEEKIAARGNLVFPLKYVTFFFDFVNCLFSHSKTPKRVAPKLKNNAVHHLVRHLKAPKKDENWRSG